MDRIFWKRAGEIRKTVNLTPDYSLFITFFAKKVAAGPVLNLDSAVFYAIVRGMMFLSEYFQPLTKGKKYEQKNALLERTGNRSCRFP
ncbi:MAG: hypothetical protein IJ992_04620, partial [Lentisphaeria bacterium]|nr:hypothetical protein [Lentisphaeria bacterium]